MRYFLMVFFNCLVVGGVLAQQLFVEAYSAYNLTAYDREIYNDTKGYFPLGFKVAGGHQHVQVGIDYRQHLTNPKFEFSELGVDLGRHEFKETFYGAFVRGNISSLPAYRFGLILSAGAGYYQPTFLAYAPTGQLLSEVDYKRKLGYNGYIGVSAPIFGQLHWEIGYQYNRIDRQELVAEKIPGYAANYHMIHVGLSGNFVFGNTAKRCRRVMEMKRR